MTKNKLVLYSIPNSRFESFVTIEEKAKNLMEQIKSYFDSEGFITSEIDITGDSNHNYYLDIGVEGYTTKFYIQMNYNSISKYNCYLGIKRDGNILQSIGSSYTITFDTKYNFVLNYFVNENCNILLAKSDINEQSVGIGFNPLLIFKSENGDEYYKIINSSNYIYKSKSGESYTFNYPSNYSNVNKAVIAKIPSFDSYIKGVYALTLPSRAFGVYVSSNNYDGGIFINLKGYGIYFCINTEYTDSSSKNIKKLLAIPLTEETTETVTTTPTDESQTT